jgi:hypothetical protein
MLRIEPLAGQRQYPQWSGAKFSARSSQLQAWARHAEAGSAASSELQLIGPPEGRDHASIALPG